MAILIIPLKCEGKEFEFDLYKIADQHWEKFIKDIVFAKLPNAKNVKINGAKIIIRDNKAKVSLFYNDGNYHEVLLRLDEFGRISQEYKDEISKIWQDLMFDYYGKKYKDALDSKFDTLKI